MVELESASTTTQLENTTLKFQLDEFKNELNRVQEEKDALEKRFFGLQEEMRELEIHAPVDGTLYP